MYLIEIPEGQNLYNLGVKTKQQRTKCLDNNSWKLGGSDWNYFLPVIVDCVVGQRVKIPITARLC